MAEDKVVFTDGVFDLFHANHISFLKQARTFGDRLVVGVISDKAAAQYKRQPIMTQAERLCVVVTQPFVDQAFIIDGMIEPATLERIIAAYDISVVVYAGNDTPEFYRPAERMNIMRRIPYRDGITTSTIIERIVDRYVSRPEGLGLKRDC